MSITFRPGHDDGSKADERALADLVYLQIQASDGSPSVSRINGFVTPAVRSLVHAAPDLLASLVEVCDWICDGLAQPEGTLPDDECLRLTEQIASRARTAIAKATPGSST